MTQDEYIMSPQFVVDSIMKASRAVVIGEPAACKLLHGKRHLDRAVMRGWVTPIMKGGAQRQHRQFILAEILQLFDNNKHVNHVRNLNIINSRLAGREVRGLFSNPQKNQDMKALKITFNMITVVSMLIGFFLCLWGVKDISAPFLVFGFGLMLFAAILYDAITFHEDGDEEDEE